MCSDAGTPSSRRRFLAPSAGGACTVGEPVAMTVDNVGIDPIRRPTGQASVRGGSCDGTGITHNLDALEPGRLFRLVATLPSLVQGVMT